VHGYSTVADLVLMEVLGRFIHESINWLDRAEREAREGNVNDDRFVKGVRNVGHPFFLSPGLLSLLPRLVVSLLHLIDKTLRR
jgi:hypothetical protein